MIERSFPCLRLVRAQPAGGSRRRLAGLAAGIIMLAMVTRQGMAAGFPPAFVVADVPVDATAATAVLAREAARADGTRKAFRQLLERLSAKGDWARLPQPGDQMVLDLLQDFEVKGEHSSSVRYLASYTYRFSPNGVRKLLRDAHVAILELVSKPVVIVPVLQAGGPPLLWNDPNPWRAAWSAADGKAGLVPWVLPAGDLADVNALDAPSTPKPSAAQLAALARNYDNGDIVIATARVGVDGLDVTAVRYGPDGSGDPVTVSLGGVKGDPALYAAAVQATERALEDRWKQLVGSGGDQDSVIQVSVPITSAADWGAVRERIGKIPFVRAQQVDLFARNEVRLRLRVRADDGLLKIGFAQQDMIYAPGAGSATLRLRAPIPVAKPAAPEPAPASEPASGED